MPRPRPLLLIPFALSAALLTACPGGPTTTDTALASISLSCAPGTVTVGAAATCTAQARNATGAALDTQPTFTYRSSAPAATVNDSGTVNGVSAGTASITASSGRLTSNPVTIMVAAPRPGPTVASIRLTCQADSVPVGGTTPCTATALNAAGNALSPQPALSFQSDAPAVATVSAAGVVQGVSAGRAQVTASGSGVTSSPVTVTVTAPTPPTSQGNVQVTVRDALTGGPLTGVTFDLCATAATCAAVTAAEQPAGVYSLTTPAVEAATLVLHKVGYHAGEYLNLNVAPNQTTVLEQFLAIDNTVVGNGTVTARMVNATTGAPLSGVTIRALPGLNASAGTATATAETDTGGQYTLTLPTGYYTLVASLNGFVTTSSSVSVIGGRSLNVGDRALSPVLAGDGEWRFVLTWGDRPRDLDSHLTGPTAAGGRFHVYYARKGHTDSLGSVNLDVDDVSSYGPETVTVTDTPEGLLRYSVHDYSNAGKVSSAALSASGARVQVYRGSALLATYNVPSGQGDLWTVFTLDLSSPASPRLVPMNTITTVGGASSVQRTPGRKEPLSVP